MKKIILIILALFFVLINTVSDAAQNFVKKDYKIQAADGFSIRATLSYPKVKNQKEYKTVMLLHSLGYNSQWWGDLPNQFLNKGYAVLTIDLRGHGNSIYNKNLAKVSWKSMTNYAYSKYPSDIVSVINYINDDNPKRKFFEDWAIVGSDIGAVTGIIAADKYSFKPKTIVMISPVVKAKGLYAPVAMAQLDGVDFLSIIGTDDYVARDAETYLKKFAQNGFTDYTSPSKTTGMLMLKNDPEVVKLIYEWVGQYLDQPIL